MLAEKIIEKLRGRIDAGDEEVIAGTGTGDVEEVALGVIDLCEVSVVGDALDTRLERDDFVVAGGDHHSAEFETLGEVYRADSDRSVSTIRSVS